jgi:predicted dinucleotide-binding enzyme
MSIATDYKVGVLGTGGVGRTLGSAFIELGHAVKLGARTAENPTAEAWARTAGSLASTGSFADAAAFGDVIVVATLGVATEDVLHAADPASFAGKIVLDTTNPLVLARGQRPTLAFGHSDSLGERVQRLLATAHVVKVFNSVCHGLMIRPTFDHGPPDMFLAGNDPDAKRFAAELCATWGWGAVDLGGIDASRFLEPMVIAWLYAGLQRGLPLSTSGTWTHAFKLLQR